MSLLHLHAHFSSSQITHERYQPKYLRKTSSARVIYLGSMPETETEGGENRMLIKYNEANIDFLIEYHLYCVCVCVCMVQRRLKGTHLVSTDRHASNRKTALSRDGRMHAQINSTILIYTIKYTPLQKLKYVCAAKTHSKTNAFGRRDFRMNRLL